MWVASVAVAMAFGGSGDCCHYLTMIVLVQVVQQQVMAVHDGSTVSGAGAGGASVAMGMMTQNPQAVTLVASSMPSGMTQAGQQQVQGQVSVAFADFFWF